MHAAATNHYPTISIPATTYLLPLTRARQHSYIERLTWMKVIGSHQFELFQSRIYFAPFLNLHRTYTYIYLPLFIDGAISDNARQ